MFRNAALLALSFVTTLTLAAPPKEQPKISPPASYTMLKAFRNFAVGIDGKSIKNVGKGDLVLISIDVQVVMAEAIPDLPSPKTIKAFQNRVVVDCKRDSLYVLHSIAIDEKYNVIRIDTTPALMQNPNNDSPISVVLEFVCKTPTPPSDGYRQDGTVTKRGYLTT